MINSLKIYIHIRNQIKYFYITLKQLCFYLFIYNKAEKATLQIWPLARLSKGKKMENHPKHGVSGFSKNAYKCQVSN